MKTIIPNESETTIITTTIMKRMLQILVSFVEFVGLVLFVCVDNVVVETVVGVVVTDVPTVGIVVSTVDTVVRTSLSGIGVDGVVVEVVVSVVMDVGVVVVCDVVLVNTL